MDLFPELAFSWITLFLLLLFIVQVVLLLKASEYANKECKLVEEIESYGLKRLPGPRPWPIIGNIPTMAKFKNPWDGFSELKKIYGDVYGLTLGTQNVLLVNSFESIREVLVYKSTDFAHRPNFERFEAIFRGHRNASVALSDWSDKHRVRRTIIYPYTHPRTNSSELSFMTECISAEMGHVIDDLEATANAVIDPIFILSTHNANMFYRYFCNTRFEPKDEKFQKIIMVYKTMFDDLVMGNPIDFLTWLRYFTSHLAKLTALSQYVSDATKQIFDDHKKHDKYQDMIELLTSPKYLYSIHGGNTMTDLDLQVIVEDLIGGHTAVANMWLWLLYFLAAYPEVQDRIRRETRGSGKPNSEHKFPYLEATILELLRVVSSPIIPHKSVKQTSVDGYFVPKETVVIFNTVDINMDPKLWDRPEEFEPERFFDENGRIIKPEYFIPFGIGKRACIGDSLVRNTLIIGTIAILKKFSIELDPALKPIPLTDIPGIVVPPHALKMVFKNRATNH